MSDLSSLGTVLSHAALAAASISAVLLCLAVLQARSPRRPAWLTRLVSLLGLSLAFATPAAAAGSRRPDSPVRIGSAAASPPWISPGGNPPPRPPVESGVAPPWKQNRSAHPAIHVRRQKVDAPLFPRVRATDPCEDKRACMERHPAGRDVPRLAHGEIYVVRPGDTLWAIAGRVLETSDIRAIARYWPRIHKANREVIGPNPDLIRPGQRLRLPEIP